MITQQFSVIIHPMNRNYPMDIACFFSFHGLSAVSWPLRPRTPSWSAAAAPGRWRRHRPHQPRYRGDRRCLRNICEKSSCLGGKFEGSHGESKGNSWHVGMIFVLELGIMRYGIAIVFLSEFQAQHVIVFCKENLWIICSFPIRRKLVCLNIQAQQ